MSTAVILCLSCHRDTVHTHRPPAGNPSDVRPATCTRCRTVTAWAPPPPTRQVRRAA